MSDRMLDEDEMAEANHVPDEEPNVVDPTDRRVWVVDAPEDEEE